MSQPVNTKDPQKEGTYVAMNKDEVKKVRRAADTLAVDLDMIVRLANQIQGRKLINETRESGRQKLLTLRQRVVEATSGLDAHISSLADPSQ